MLEWMRRHRRNIGIPFIVVSLLLARFDDRYLMLSVLLATTGELLRIWSAGHLRKEEVLTTGGPYRWIRNPLYLGSFLITGGFCLIAGSLWIWLLAVTYFGLCYAPVIRYEERVLAAKFPDEFPQYAAAVPALYPTVKSYPHKSTRFSWQQVLVNKEYNAVIGILIAYAYFLFLSR
jgi:protein-S-isoprenylcysteine O-methyltransferase Ste14